MPFSPSQTRLHQPDGVHEPDIGAALLLRRRGGRRHVQGQHGTARHDRGRSGRSVAAGSATGQRERGVTAVTRGSITGQRERGVTAVARGSTGRSTLRAVEAGREKTCDCDQ